MVAAFSSHMPNSAPHDTPAVDSPDASEAAESELPVVELLGTAEAAKLMGVSERTMARRINEGTLPAKRDRRAQGHPWRISKSVVLEMGPAVRKRTPRQERVDIEGELAAAAFKLFEDCVEPVQIVIRLKAQPEAIMKLHSQWLALRALAPAQQPAATPPAPSKPVKEIDWSAVVTPEPEVK